MKTIEERIAEAREEVEALDSREFGASPAWQRVEKRARARLVDLEAVRDKRAVEVYATVCAGEDRMWASYGCWNLSPREADTLRATHDPGDRVTVLRGIAYLPVATTDEAEAESEEA